MSTPDSEVESAAPDGAGMGTPVAIAGGRGLPASSGSVSVSVAGGTATGGGTPTDGGGGGGQAAAAAAAGDGDSDGDDATMPLRIAHDSHVGVVVDGRLVCEVEGPGIVDGSLAPAVQRIESHSLGPADLLPAPKRTPKPCCLHEHTHGPGCGHRSVPHDGHNDYLVADELHHQDGDNCVVHGRVKLLRGGGRHGGSSQRSSHGHGHSRGHRHSHGGYREGATGGSGGGGSVASGHTSRSRRTAVSQAMSRSKFTAYAHTAAEDVVRRTSQKVARQRAAQLRRRTGAGARPSTAAGGAEVGAYGPGTPPRGRPAAQSIDTHASYTSAGAPHVYDDAALDIADVELDADLAAMSPALPWYRDLNTMRFVAMSFLTGGYFVVELVYGAIIGSLALQADAFHMASDLIALFVGFYSLQAAKRAASGTASFGWTRMEVVGALMNGVFLLATCFNISMEAIHRFTELDEVKEALEGEGADLMTVALIGLGVNVLGLFIFGGGHGHSHGGGGGHGHSHGGGHGHSHGGGGDSDGHGHSHGGGDDESHGHSHGGGHGHSHSGGGDVEDGGTDTDAASKTTDEAPAASPGGRTSMNANIRGVLLHVLGDALGSVGVIISGLVIEHGESLGDSRYMADPLCSLIIVVIIVTGTVPLVKRCVHTLLQHAPRDLDIGSLHRGMLRVDGVLDVHDFHVWELTDSVWVGSVHVVVARDCDFMKASDQIKLMLHAHGVHSTTVQPEFVDASAFGKYSHLETCHEPVCGEECVTLGVPDVELPLLTTADDSGVAAMAAAFEHERKASAGGGGGGSGAEAGDGDGGAHGHSHSHGEAPDHAHSH